jgi:hypothetical protein
MNTLKLHVFSCDFPNLNSHDAWAGVFGFDIVAAAADDDDDAAADVVHRKFWRLENWVRLNFYLLKLA